MSLMTRKEAIDYPHISERNLNRIRDLREAKGMTQQQLADALGVNQSTVDRYEKGVIKLSLNTALRIISVLGCTMSQLTGQDIT